MNLKPQMSQMSQIRLDAFFSSAPICAICG